jgi:hypothetical protein
MPIDDDASARSGWCLGCAEQGLRHSHEAQAEALLALATAQGFPLYMGRGTYRRGLALAMQGPCKAGLARVHQGMVPPTATRQELLRPLQLDPVAEVAGHADEVTEGPSWLAEALASLETSGRGDLRAEASRRQGECPMQQAPLRCSPSRSVLSAGPRHRRWPAGEVAGAAGRGEPEPPVALAGQL